MEHPGGPGNRASDRGGAPPGAVVQPPTYSVCYIFVVDFFLKDVLWFVADFKNSYGKVINNTDVNPINLKNFLLKNILNQV